MFRPLARSHRRSHRRGTSFILIVVVGISVFAVVGTAFALFAMQQAKLGQARKDAEGGGGVPPLLAPNPTDTVNAFLGGLIYDTGDTDADIFNALRGHSMARSMYGRDVSQFTLGLAATTPWNGVGLFREDVATDPAYSGGYNLTGDRARLINYTVNPVNGLPFLLDPEYMGQRYAGAMGTMVPVFDPTTRTYVSKAAGYSYADTKDFFAGAVDPVTGAVLVQSFHRDWLFRDPLRPATESPLHPNNANWINAQGVLLTLRPRPFEDPQFPRVPMNADGTYTGDVQNFPGGYTAVLDTTTNPPKYRFHSRNDSLWMDLGLPIITLPGNRKVQPMVAPLIVPIDGLFNASAHGSNYGGSYAGYGPWAVNMAAALGGDAAAVVTARNKLAAPQQRNGATTRAYNPYNPSPLPSYAPVAWDNTAASLTYPTGSSFTGLPSFGGAQSTNAVVNNHPSLFNPTEWPGDNTATLRTFGLGDTKRVLRHSFVPDYYAQADLVAAAPNVLYPNPTSFPYVFGTGQSTANNYRLDPSHGIRGLITTRGYELDRPKVAPSFVISSVTMSPPPRQQAVHQRRPVPDPDDAGRR